MKDPLVLAHWLRFLLLAQTVAGAWIGHTLCGGWLAMAAGVLTLTLASTALVCLVSAWEARSGESAVLWWRALVGECGAALRIYVFQQPWTFSAPAVLAASATPTRAPVVLVHGYLCNHRIWDGMADALRAQGHAVLAINLEPVFSSIDDYATVVQSAVVNLRQQTGAAEVALVGHSMGGLAIRAWLRAYGSAQACRVVTLGTPHVGTQIAPGTNATPNGRQMQWHSDWLGSLAASEADSTRALFRLALTAQDNIVFPQRAQVLAGVAPQVFTGIGHLQMCLDANVIAWTAQQLADLPLVQSR